MKNQPLHPRTAVLNKSQKNHSKKTRTEALTWLAVTFPQAFDNTMRISPLKIGIMDDILAYAEEAQAAGISKSKLREAVVLYTRRIDYLTCLKAQEIRIDLNGLPVDKVSAADAERAILKIKKRIEKGIRNAREAMAQKLGQNRSTTSYKPAKPLTRYVSKTAHEEPSEKKFVPIYPPRAQAISPQPSAPRANTVVVKHKTTRQFDPDAVARLKEKLGITRKAEQPIEEISDE